MRRFSPFGETLWYATAPDAPPTGPLEGSEQAEVCIVGAGYAGLTTALELAQKGIRVVLLEREEIGFGGSGRNAGHCTPTFTHYSLPDLRRVLGEPWADRLIQRQTRANDTVAAMVQRYGLRCEWVQTGYIQGALYPSHIKVLEAKTRDYNAVGARTRMLSAAEVAAMTGSARFYGGWLHEEGGAVNALAYARELGRAVQQEGGRIFTGSGVTGCARVDGRWSVRTEKGEVRAEKVIFTTGAYTVGGWPKLENSFHIMRVFVAATQILSPETRQVLLPANTTMHDGRGDIYVYKYNGEGRIVASMFPMGRRGRDMDYTRQVMSDRLTWLHPQIREDIRWDFFWYGELDMQRRTIPRLYALAPGVVAMTGLSGRGVPTGSMLGGILSEWALEVPERDLSLRLEPLHRSPPYMAVAPQLALRGYRLRDWAAARIEGAPLPPHP